VARGCSPKISPVSVYRFASICRSPGNELKAPFGELVVSGSRQMAARADCGRTFARSHGHFDALQVGTETGVLIYKTSELVAGYLPSRAAAQLNFAAPKSPLRERLQQQRTGSPSLSEKRVPPLITDRFGSPRNEAQKNQADPASSESDQNWGALRGALLGRSGGRDPRSPTAQGQCSPSNRAVQR
jgi:hypothetical protein